MNRSSKLVAAIAAGALALGLGMAPAQATTSKKSSNGSSLTVSFQDIKTSKGKFSNKKWLKLKVAVPKPYTHTDGHLVESTWSLHLSKSSSGKTTCSPSDYIPDGVGSKSVTIPLKGQGYKRISNYYSEYWGSGKCSYKATLTVNREGDAAQGIASYSETIKVNASYRNQTKSRTTLSAASSVKKNKSLKVSGVAKFQSPKSKFAYKNIKKGVQVKVQHQKNGKGAWKTVKTTKVGSNGKWSTKVKLKTKGKIRAVVVASNETQQSVTKAKSIKIKK